MNITQHQREQLDIATSGMVGILTGAAGTGKSHVVAELLRHREGTYYVAAPTGKAASRINQENRLFNASTIHSLLRPERNGHDGMGWQFAYNRFCPLSTDLLVIDEAPMVSSELMAPLLDAIDHGTQVLFVGDPNQLPPVGHGCPVFDMLKSGRIPHGHLSEVHRHSGRIAQVANAINAGEPWQPSPVVDLEADFPENLKHVHAVSGMVGPAIVKILKKLQEKPGLDPVNDIQVICPLNSSGDLSRKELNKIVSGVLMPPDADQCEKMPFQLGEKIICTKNQMLPIHDELNESPGKFYVANGETGVVVSPLLGFNDKVVGIIFRTSTGVLLEVKGGSLKEFEPAWAITVHKSQGSQSLIVICVIDPQGSRVASRQFWYTAITRASRLAILVGPMIVLHRQCERIDIEQRRTFLAERIQQLCPEPTNSASALSPL